MNRNVGGRDRLARAGLAVLALVVAAGAALAGRPVIAAIALLAAAGAGFNALVGWCGVNAALGIDTTE